MIRPETTLPVRANGDPDTPSSHSPGPFPGGQARPGRSPADVGMVAGVSRAASTAMRTTGPRKLAADLPYQRRPSIAGHRYEQAPRRQPPRRAEHPVPPRPGWPARPWIARWRGSRTSGGGNPNLRSAIPRSHRWLGGIDPRSGRRLAAAGLAGVQPAVVGMGTGDVAVGGVSPADGTAPGLASASAVVVTGPAELPLNQADQDSCQ